VLASVCILSRYRGAMTAAAAYSPGGPGRPPFANASPAGVRAALIPEEAAEFDRQWREAMARATESQDLTEVLELLEGWRRVAWMTAEAGPEAHRRMYRRGAARLTGQGIPAGEPLTRTKARLGL
jgi:DNA-binding FadR family transcriptional regulator